MATGRREMFGRKAKLMVGVLAATAAALAVSMPATSGAGPLEWPPGTGAETPAAAISASACGKIKSRSIYPKAKIRRIRGVSCKKAKKVARAYDHKGRSIGRWECFLAHSDGRRLFSCGRGKGSGDVRNRRHALEAIGKGTPR